MGTVNKRKITKTHVVMKSVSQKHIDFSELNNLKVFRSNYITYSVLGLLISVCIMIASSSFSVAMLYLGFLLFSITAFMMLVLAVTEKNRSKKIEDFNQNIIHQFAHANNFQYIFEDTAQRMPGSIFNSGTNKKANHIISGNYNNLPFVFYRYAYEIQTNKSSVIYDLQVFELTLPRKVPHMVIDSLVENGNGTSSTLHIIFDKSQKLVLEGDFYKYFDLYAPDKYGITALTIIAPDVMEVLMKFAAKCDIEIIDNKIYFYWPDTAVRREDYENNFSTVFAVLDKIQKKLVSSDIFASTSQANVHSQSTAKGSRLKKNVWAIYLTLLFVAVSPLYVAAYEIYPGMRTLLIGCVVGFVVIRMLHEVYKQRKKKYLQSQLKKREF